MPRTNTPPRSNGSRGTSSRGGWRIRTHGGMRSGSGRTTRRCPPSNRRRCRSAPRAARSAPWRTCRGREPVGRGEPRGDHAGDRHRDADAEQHERRIAEASGSTLPTTCVQHGAVGAGGDDEQRDDRRRDQRGEQRRAGEREESLPAPAASADARRAGRSRRGPEPLNYRTRPCRPACSPSCDAWRRRRATGYPGDRAEALHGLRHGASATPDTHS